MNMSNEVNEIFCAFSAFQEKVEDVKRDTQSYKGKYATLDQVVQVRKLLSSFGLCVTQVIGDCSKGFVELENIVMHKSGQFFSEKMKMPIGDLPKGISVAQHIGSNVSYARRYGLLSILCMAQEDDDAQIHSNNFIQSGKIGKISDGKPILNNGGSPIEKLFDLIAVHSIPEEKIDVWKHKYGVNSIHDLNDQQAIAIINKIYSVMS